MNCQHPSLLFHRPIASKRTPPRRVAWTSHYHQDSLQQKYDYALLLYNDFDKVVTDHIEDSELIVPKLGHLKIDRDLR